jgi:hypothetical protein
MSDSAKSAATAAAAEDSTGMGYLESLPRRLVTVYLPLLIFIFVLLFPFYWIGVTTFKPNDELYNFSDHNPFWIDSPTLANIHKLLFETDYPQWLLNTMTSLYRHFPVDLRSVLAAYASPLHFSAPDSPCDLPPPGAQHPVHPAGDHRVPARHLRHQVGADPHLSDVPDPVLHLAADGLLQEHSV